jgi:hypothetical protein
MLATERHKCVVAHEVGFLPSGTGPDFGYPGVGNANRNRRSIGNCRVADSPARGDRDSHHRRHVVSNSTGFHPHKVQAAERHTFRGARVTVAWSWLRGAATRRALRRTARAEDASRQDMVRAIIAAFYSCGSLRSLRGTVAVEGLPGGVRRARCLGVPDSRVRASRRSTACAKRSAAVRCAKGSASGSGALGLSTAASSLG